MQVAIYCSGGIAKGTGDSSKLLWSKQFEEEFAETFRPYNPIFLRPSDPIPHLSNVQGLFGRDIAQIQNAQLIVVDARQRRGIGVGVEMLLSKIFGKYLLVICPHESHYRQKHIELRGQLVEDYLHPHIGVMADSIVEDFRAAGAQAKRAIENKYKPKGIEVLDACEKEYFECIYADDVNMKEFLKI